MLLLFCIAAEHKVRIHTVCYGEIEPTSNIIDSMTAAPDPAGTPDQIAVIVLGLCSIGISAMTGQIIMIE